MAGQPQDQAAAFFLERKGIYDAQLRDITKLDGHDCWYYVFDLEEDERAAGTIELEVEWTGEEWSTRVTTFLPA